MRARTGWKCEPVVRSLTGCGEFGADFPGLQIGFVVVGSCDFEVVIEVGGITCGVGASFAHGRHGSRGTDGEAIDFVGKITVCDAGSGNWCRARHAMRALHIW